MSQKIFLDYDQAALDAQYDNRAKVPEFPQYLERYRAASVAARERFAGDARLEVPVGPTRDRAHRHLPRGRLRAGTGPGVHPRRLLADARQGGLQLRRQRLRAARHHYRGGQLRADPDRAHGRTGQAVSPGGGLGAGQRRQLRRGSGSGGRRRPFRGRTPDRHGRCNRLGPLHRAARARAGVGAAAGRLLHQRPARPGADQPLLPAAEPAAVAAGGVRQQPDEPGARRETGTWTALVGGKEGPEYHRQSTELARRWAAGGNSRDVARASSTGRIISPS